MARQYLALCRAPHRGVHHDTHRDARHGSHRAVACAVACAVTRRDMRRGAPLGARRCLTLVKKYLQTINEQRKNEQNQPDLRGAFSKITEFSLEEAIQWEKEVEDVERKKE